MTAYSTLTAALLDPDGTIDPTTINRLRRGLRTWLLAGGTLPLPRCLGLPATPGQMRRALRDVHLARAAALLDDGTTWQRAKALDRRARHFLAYRWPAWFSLREPPADANLMDAELWHATKAAGGRLPGSPQALRVILEKHFPVES